jgi:hypothetical protein
MEALQKRMVEIQQRQEKHQQQMVEYLRKGGVGLAKL